MTHLEYYLLLLFYDALTFSPHHKTEVQIVYHLELHLDVNNIPKRFEKYNFLYFLRNTKGRGSTLNLCLPKIAYLTDISDVLFNPETIIEPVDMHEANNLMPKLIEFGMMNDNPLMMLRGLLNHVCD